MKTRLILPITSALFFLVVSCFQTKVYADGTNPWHSLAQWQRNQAIINRAYQDFNVNVGVECKPWVYNVVYQAANNFHVRLPSNMPAPNNYYWQSDSYGHDVAFSIPIKSVQIGWIIQMRLKNGVPHTAIVVGNTGSGITFIDSNYVAPLTVKTHYLSYADFYNSLASPSSYSVHYIL